jgi:hypothetical protein
MTDIDWSKAPEGATHYLQMQDRPNRDYWVKVAGDKIFFCRLGFELDGFRPWIFDYQRFLPFMVERPATQPAWSGDCLPPVGVVCEYNAHGERDSGKELWCQVQVKYLSEWVIVFECTKAPDGHEASVGVELFGDISSKLENRFRPIRTPEQIAADEREAAVNRIYDILEGSKRPDLMSTCRALYDAGLRFKDDAQ